ncbi:MAG: methionine synthase, partial [Fidelibacterota bacterium]
DGAMGTAIQQRDLSPEHFVLKEPKIRAEGCNELLSLTRPDVIGNIHSDYLKAGADIIETNTFGANAFSLGGYGLSDLVYEINRASAEIARKAVRDSAGSRQAFVAGVLGPSGRTLSFSPSVDDPAYRETDFKDFLAVYREQISGLLDGGVDILLIETVFDTLVAKAALTAAMEEFDQRGVHLPVMVSATFSDKSLRTLSGQTLEAFIVSLSSYPIFSLGINCSTGAAEMVPLIRELSTLSPFHTSAHPNAGFPDNEGNYRQTPEAFASLIRPVLEEGCLSIAGGCCGTRPEHIAAIAEAAAGGRPHQIPEKDPVLTLSGLDILNIPVNHTFITVGERANVAGSRRFARLIREEKYEKALSLACKQIDQGAQIIDICMDAPLIDAPAAMRRFLRLLAAHPVAARVPVMVDSSSWDVIETALGELQGRSIVNSISLKEGEEDFLSRARYIHRMGAVVMVMLFDERGQADTFARKCSVAERVYRLLTEKTDIPPESIIVDPNILSIATGIDAHDVYARDFIRAVAWIKEHFPLVKVSGGLSNLSFAFRGNNALRKAMHTVFLELAVEAGLDMAIVDPAMEQASTSIPEKAKAIIREAFLLENNDGPSARNALIGLAMSGTLDAGASPVKKTGIDPWRTKDVHERLSEAIIRGEDSFLDMDLQEANKGNAIQLIEGPLMKGMSEVGKLFGEGRLFLPQVVRSARMMKKAVDFLRPYLKERSGATAKIRGTVVLATVKGDVHNIGKNIVSLILQCSHFRIVDLGVMVRPEKIVCAATENNADMVGLSGLITPSLEEMAVVCKQFEAAGSAVPLLIGGATTSEAHTATKLAPLYPGKVVYSPDASHAAATALEIVSANAKSYLKRTAERYSRIAGTQKGALTGLRDLEYARSKRYIKKHAASLPEQYGVRVINDIPLDRLIPAINRRMLARAWQLKPGSEEARRIERDTMALLDDPGTAAVFQNALRAVAGLFPANAHHEEVYIYRPDRKERLATLHFMRRQLPGEHGSMLSLADFVMENNKGPSDTAGLFVASAGAGISGLAEQYRKEGDDYRALLSEILADRLAEALSEYLHQWVAEKWWKLEDIPSIRPAAGYPSAADHSEKGTIFSVLNAEKHTGVSLSENFAMYPAASVCGYYFAGKGVHNFSLGPLGSDQLREYAQRKGISREFLRKVLAAARDRYEHNMD